nr:DUF523 and DUF1722 domain-containing protein [Orenia metallireducens]
MQFVKPIVVVSKCLEFDKCRYNGVMISDEFVKKLKDYVEFIPVCPEVEVGLGVPRETIRLVKEDDEIRLVQPATKRDITDKMKQFSAEFLDSLEQVDGFILKDRSPSCGTKDSKVYSSIDKSSMVIEKSNGLFAQKVEEIFPYAVVENEGRLKNFRIREDFLTKLFLLARFRKVKESKSMSNLVQFQAENKLLFFAYKEVEMREIGKIVANHQNSPWDEVIKEYEEHLHKLLKGMTTYKANINALMHAFGYFSKELSSEEKRFFLDTLDKYRDNKVPLSVPNNILEAWIIKYDKKYLKEQSFFHPYPEELIEIKDSGKGRDY